MLTQYTEIMGKYEDFSKKVQAYDSKKDDMSKADLDYYLDVINRCNKKMIEVAYTE